MPVVKERWPLSPEQAKVLQERAAKELGIAPLSQLQIADRVFVDLAVVPAGVSPMGSDSAFGNPPREVAISRSFLISRCELTWRQFLAIVDVSKLDSATQEMANDALKNENELELAARTQWRWAKMFCVQLSKTSGVKARMPTEAEWEYACRAGTTALYGEWDTIDDTKADISFWWDGEGNRCATTRPLSGFTPPGQYQPNRWGIHDMMGGRDEWCFDTFKNKIETGAAPIIDPVVFQQGSPFHVVRGGGTNARTVFERDGDAASGNSRGIRLVIEVDDATKARLTAAATTRITATR